MELVGEGSPSAVGRRSCRRGSFRKAGLHVELSSTLSGDIMVPTIEEDCFLLLGYAVLYKRYNLTTFNHPQNRYPVVSVDF